jgi:cysteine-rich repeat protein
MVRKLFIVGNPIWGNWLKESSEEWDDGNNNGGDGWDLVWEVETGWQWLESSATNITSSCSIICGDGKLTATEECDDGDTDNLDGCNSVCKVEPGFNCTIDTNVNPQSTWEPICGDGKRLLNEDWDDGNLINGDGCSSQWEIEPEYSCYGGSQSSPDIWVKVWGDGVPSSDPLTCDDGNLVSGDGWSSDCLIESGYTWSNVPGFSSVCDEIWGDGKLYTNNPLKWDDGNTIDDDGWSSTWIVEPKYTCSGGSPTKKSLWEEIWGDGFNMGYFEWDDDDLDDGDGCSSTWVIEKCFECIGGTPTSNDICTPLEINATMSIIQSDYSFLITFDHEMLNSSVGLNDLFISITSETIVKFSWTAQYQNNTALLVKMNIKSALQGGETLTIKFVNDKVFRGPNGGWVKPASFTSKLTSSLASVAATAEAASNIMQYVALGGTVVAFGSIMVLGGSLEMVWSLINTIQIISFLPLMIDAYPEHVTIMFGMLDFSNMDFSFISDKLTDMIPIEGLSVSWDNPRYLANGIESPLFLQNCASMIFSLFTSISSLLLILLLYSVLRWEKARDVLSAIISSYFFNNFLRFLTEGYLEMTLKAVLNVVEFTVGSKVEVFSLILAFIGMGVCLLFPAMTFALLYDKKTAIRAENKRYLKRFGTMYRDFKVHKEWYLYQYYPIFMLRRLVFVFFLIAFFKYPSVQCNFLIFCSGLVSAVLINRCLHTRLWENRSSTK